MVGVFYFYCYVFFVCVVSRSNEVWRRRFFARKLIDALPKYLLEKSNETICNVVKDMPKERAILLLGGLRLTLLKWVK